jgi:hypothetical protein
VEKCKTMIHLAEPEEVSADKWKPFGGKFETYYKKAFRAK